MGETPADDLDTGRDDPADRFGEEPVHYAMFLTMYSCGLRRSELCRLKVSNIDSQISNHRLMAFDGERVTFRWKDYAHGGKQRKMTLSATEFLRRFSQHILPRGFVRIRQYGFLATRHRAANLALSR